VTTEGVDQLQRFAAQMATQGAVLVQQLEPTVDLERLSATDASRLARHGRGRLALGALVVAAAVLLWLDRVPTGPSPELPLGRLLAVAAAAATPPTLLTTCWRPLGAVVAQVLEPLGRVPLLVLLAHVLVLLLVADLGARGAPLTHALDGAVTGTAVDLLALAALVLLARWRLRAARRRAVAGARLP